MNGWKPYPYQQEVSELLLAGKSLVLQAPTGAGKTTAALLPFIHSRRKGTNLDFPSKCIYVVPMRVLANQFVHEWKGLLDSLGRRYGDEISVCIQTGERQGDRRFESDLIFCTIDQALSSFLTMPFSLPRRIANLNAGALAGAYLVFDEFHLLDPSSSLPTTLYAIKQLQGLAPVLLMTATFSEPMLKELAAIIGATPYLVSGEEAHAIATRGGAAQPNRRIWQTAREPLSAQIILDSHHRRTLVLCNTVQRAQAIYRKLRDLGRNKGIETLLLNSRFRVQDRRFIEEQMRAEFGKQGGTRASLIAVATQTIEVGVDISCETLHTELAPASSLIQRAGRCARYPGEAGTVIVYPAESYAPYRDRSKPESQDPWVQEMNAAFAWLKEHHGQSLDFAGEQEFVNAVTTPRDRQILTELSAGAPARAQAIHGVLQGNRQGDARRLLIRDADSRTVLIHPQPDALLDSPYSAEGFNVSVDTLRGMARQWLERDVDVDWRVLALAEDDVGAEDNRTRYAWKPLHDARQIGAAQVVAVHPSLAGYLQDEGFVADVGNTDFVSTIDPHSRDDIWEGRSYRMESYEQHIAHVLAAFEQKALPELRHPAAALERAAGWREGSVVAAAWLVCLLHDVGKLNSGWQAWAHHYQALIGKPVAAHSALAHTDREWNNQTHSTAEKRTRQKHPKPRHAAEGALAVGGILADALDRNELLTRAALTAIARHHAPFVSECTAFTLTTNAHQHIAATVAHVPAAIGTMVRLDLLRPQQKAAPIGFANLLISPAQGPGWVAYTLLARALRRADQQGTEWGMRDGLAR